MNIPRDFESPWPFSDAILLVEDAEGNEKKLHVDKKFLATHSSFFERLFFSEFKEANSESVKVSCSYEIMKLILQIIYGMSRGELILSMTFEIPMLMDLYKAGDYLDLPLIRNICKKQMTDRPSAEMTIAVFQMTGEFHLHDTLMDIVKQTNPIELNGLFSVDDTNLIFSKADVKIFYERIGSKPFPIAQNQLKLWEHCPIPRYDFYHHCNNRLVDSTKKWPGCSLLIKTKNSDGKELFSSKTVLAMVSPHFAERFSGRLDSQDFSEITEIELDVDYMVMKNILTIVHQCYGLGHLDCSDWEQLKMSYMMCCAASEKKLDIPRIREMFINGLEENVANGVTSDVEFDFAVKLKSSSKSYMLEGMPIGNLLDWFDHIGMRIDEDYFLENEHFAIPFVHEEEQILSLNEVWCVLSKLFREHLIPFHY